MKLKYILLPSAALFLALSSLAQQKEEAAPAKDETSESADKDKKDEASAEKTPEDAGDPWKMLRDWKNAKFSEVLEKAEIDKETTEAVNKSIAALDEKESTDHQKIREDAIAERMKALIRAGIPEDKAATIMKDYTEAVKLAEDNLKVAAEKTAKDESVSSDTDKKEGAEDKAPADKGDEGGTPVEAPAKDS